MGMPLSTVSLYNGAGGGTAGTAVTAGNSGGLSGNAFTSVGGIGTECTFDATFAHTGPLSYKCACPVAGNNVYPYWSVVTASSSLWVRAYLYMTAYPALSYAVPLDISGSYVEVTTAGNLTTNLSGGSNNTSAFTLPLNTWFRLEMQVTLGAGTAAMTARAYGTNEAYLGAVTASGGTVASLANAYFGQLASACTVTWWIADLGVSDTGWLGAYPPEDAPETGQALPPSPPPGFMSPAAFGFQPTAPQVISDVPVANAPYLIGSSLVLDSASETLTVKVTTPSNTGDTIVVFVGAVGGSVNSVIPVCADTRGNNYALVAYVQNFGARPAEFAAVNPVPLTRADSVTITSSGVPGRYNVMVVGLPGGFLGQPGGNLIPDGPGNNAGANSTTILNSVTPSAANEIALAWTGWQTPAGASPVNWPPGWTPVNTAADPSFTGVFSVAYKQVTTRSAVSLNLQLTAAQSGGLCILTTYMPETRFAPAPGQILPPPPPPGMLSPAAMPFQPVSPAVINDVPTTGAPYVIAQVAGDGATYTLKVQTRTNPGDAILVSVIANVSTGPVATCTDTQGNAYVTTALSPVDVTSQQLAAVNPVPLGPSDSLTVTIVGSSFGSRSAIVAIGIPAALAGAGTAFLAPDLGNVASSATGTNSSTAIAVATPAGLPVPAGELIFAAVMGEGLAGGGASRPQLPQGWNIVTAVTGLDGSFPDFAVIAWKRNQVQTPAGSAVVSTIQAAGNIGTHIAYTTFMAETRFAAAPGAILPAPVPPAPPGMLSPAAFPFPPPVQPANDAPPTAPQPYFAGQTPAGALASQSGTTTAFHPATPTNRGDAIIISVNSGNGGPAPAACADTQGNAYSLISYEATNQSTGIYVAQDTSPLTPTDTITVTWAAPVGGAAAIAIGCSGPALGTGSSFLTYALTAAAQAGGSSLIKATAPGPLSQTPVLVMAVLAAQGVTSAIIPQGWTVLATSYQSFSGGVGIVVMYQFTTSAIASAAVLAQAQLGAHSGALVAVALIPETRFASGPGQIIPPPPPPGMLSPAAMPFSPASPQVIDDVPVANAPYLVAQKTGPSGSGVTMAIPVQNPTRRGDAIAVLLGSQASGILPVSCTDTQGNQYSVLGPGGLIIAVNANPLTAADTITVTWASSASSAAVIVGCPAALLGAGSWLVPVISVDTAAVGSPGTGVAVSNAPLSQPSLVLAVMDVNNSNNPAALLLRGVGGTTGWNVVATSTYPNSSQSMIAAWRVIPGISVGQIIEQATFGVASGYLHWAALIPETRFAPGGPHPDLPPGMQSPGAFLYQPGPGAPFGTQYNPGPNRWTAAYPAAITGTAALTRQVEPEYTATAATAGTVTRQVEPVYKATVTTAGTTARQVQRVLLAVAATSGTLVRQVQRTLTAATATGGALVRAASRTLTVTVGTAGGVARQVGRAFTAAVTTAGTLTRTPGKQLPATTATTGSLQRTVSRPLTVTLATAGTVRRAASRTLTATVTTAGGLYTLLLRPVRFAAGWARHLWSAGNARNR